MATRQGKSSAVKDSEPEHVLTPDQETVIASMLEGKSQAEAARLAGVAPETVTRWKRNDSLFTATLQNRRRHLWDAHAQRLRNLAGQALDVVERELEGPNALRAAAIVLKSVSLADLAAPEAETTPEAVAKDRMLDSLFNML